MVTIASPSSIPSSGGVLRVNRSMECARLHGFLLPLRRIPPRPRSIRNFDVWIPVPGWLSAKPDPM
jgi:hypothetical protein